MNFQQMGGVTLDKRKVGARIKRMRKARGLTQAQLAEILDVTPKYISNLETGSKLPKLETFISLANALKCGTDALLFDALDAPATSIEDSVSSRLATLPLVDRRRIQRIIDFLIADAAFEGEPH